MMDESERWVEFGRWLTSQREEAGLKRRDAARKSKLPETLWRDLETGRKVAIGGIKLLPNPSPEILERVAGTIGVPVAELMSHAGRVSYRTDGTDGTDGATNSGEGALVAKIARLEPRDRLIVESLVDLMLEEIP